MADKLGTFYGVGVGPGDPELLTLKAVRVLESCPVLAAPQMASGEMTALSIARQAARLEGKTLLPLRFTMSRDMVKRRGSRVLPSSRAACRAMLRAVISPEAIWGAASTGQDSSTRTAFRVSSSGSPGPTPTP